ncbi:MAG: hypothetical protein R3F20_07520 [Planctomycetota bacterium]
MTRPVVLLGLLLLGAVALGGCGRDEAAPVAAKAADRAALEDPAVFEARVDESRVKLGDRVTFTAEVRHDADVEVRLPPVLDVFANALVHEAGRWEESEGYGGRRVHRIRIVLDPGLGPIMGIPALELGWRREGAEVWETIRSEPITVEVEAVTAADEDLREPSEGFELPPPPAEARERRDLRVLAAGGAVLLVLGVLAFVLLRRRRARAIVPPSPDEVARRELARLAERGLVEAGRVKEYYYVLTGILRRYIEDRFGLQAPERTTEEFLAEMRHAPAIPAEEKPTLESFLASADLVKYAKHLPAHDEARRATETARRFVEATARRAGAEGGADVAVR